MSVLVINCGSSSLKYQLFEMEPTRMRAAGHFDRIGESDGRFRHRSRDAHGRRHETTEDCALPDHQAAFATLGATLSKSVGARALRELEAIGHRVVHGGETFRKPTLIGPEVIAAIRGLIPLAPLHNPANLLGIEKCLDLFPGVLQVAVFDTAFHQTMPPHAFRYALPHALYTEHAVRRYGFHGTSHAYVAKRAAGHLGRSPESLNLITLHLGNGASATAIAGGRCVDTSMGLTPLEGLVMGTRCGDIDPALVFYLQRATGRDSDSIEALLNQDSGMKGLCGASDMREVITRADRGDDPAELALALYCYRVRKYIGAYTAVLGRLDALVFTGGVGENATTVRSRICAGLEHLGVEIDEALNVDAEGDVAEIQSRDAPVRLLMIRTDEELEIAQQTLALVRSAKTLPGGDAGPPR